ncbi:MAG: hypothetical protein F4053_14920 [Proteobacteria bacterium]|nr:hypothetical protein [Pseudomonadota bacterium]
MRDPRAGDPPRLLAGAEGTSAGGRSVVRACRTIALADAEGPSAGGGTVVRVPRTIAFTFTFTGAEGANAGDRGRWLHGGISARRSARTG